MRSTSSTTGFTLIEMLIVIPFVLLVIAGLIVAVTTVTGESLGTRAQTETAYEAQDALNKIEATVLRTTSFPTTVTVSSPQGKVAGDVKIDASASGAYSIGGVLLLTMPATDRNPLNQDREILYATGGTLNPCGDAAVTANPVYPITYAYFVKPDPLDSSKGTLVERVITSNDKGYTQSKGCTRSSTSAVDTWQRASCNKASDAPAVCKADDSVLASSVSRFELSYLAKDGTSTTTPSSATSGVLINLTASKQAGSKSVNIQMSLNAQSANM
jgi:type II secretory pathway pseudopilin PulG